MDAIGTLRMESHEISSHTRIEIFKLKNQVHGKSRAFGVIYGGGLAGRNAFLSENPILIF